MRRLLSSVAAALLVAAASLSASYAQGVPQPPVTGAIAAPDLQPVAAARSETPDPAPRPLAAALGVTGVNAAFWVFNRYIREDGKNPGFRISLDSWAENFANGFEWDDNNFATNQIGHPYQGALYFNAARASGFGFWGATPFAFAGSFQWEYFCETHHPSYNDWITTSLGGAALGEMLWRVSDLVLDETATGTDRHLREVAGLLINPVRGLSRVATGDWSRVGDNAGRLLPGSIGTSLEAGVRIVGSADPSEADTTRAFIEVRASYGDPFKGDTRRPFDTIEILTVINFGDASVLGGVRAYGLLGAIDLKETDTAHHLLGFYLNYDYFSTYAYEVGQQSVGLGLLSRFAGTPLGDLQTGVRLNGITLAGVESDYENYTGRDYNYGPGASAAVSVGLGRFGAPWLFMRHGQYWVHTINGTAGDHYLSISRVEARARIFRNVELGVQYLLYLAENRYSDLPDTHKRSPELRASLSVPFR